MQRQVGVPDRVNAPIHPVQSPRDDRPLNRLVREPELLFQLTNRHDAVLTTRQRCQSAVALRPVRSSFGPVLAPRSSFGPLDGP